MALYIPHLCFGLNEFDCVDELHPLAERAKQVNVIHRRVIRADTFRQARALPHAHSFVLDFIALVGVS